MSLTLAPLAIPSPIVDGQLRMVRQCAQPCHCTGCHHRPCVPSPPDKVLPSHPHPMLGGLPKPTRTLAKLVQATPPCCSVCCHLQPPQQHPLLPPSYPLSSVMRYFYLWEEGPPIYSVLVARIHHHGSAHNASTDLVVLANVMAPGLPIHKSTFFACGDIGPMHLTNLLQMDGLKQWRGNSVVY
jgi:hypothetical protein